MKIYLRYIFLALAATLMAVSCIEELELETPVGEADVVTFVPRIQSFANKYVTKAEYNNYEKKISTLILLVFNSDGEFVYKKDLSEGATSVTLNKSMIAKGDMSNSTVVMLANISLGELLTPNGVISDDNISSLTVSALEASTYTPSSIAPVIKSENLSKIHGLPMIGGQKGVNLTSSKDEQSALEIVLKTLYAKINFKVAVSTEGAENQDLGTGVKFNMSGCSVHNTTDITTLAIPDTKGLAKVDFLGYPVKNDRGIDIIAEADGATASENYYDDSVDGVSIIDSSTEITKGEEEEYTFYILESRFNHCLTDAEIANIYPWGTSSGYEQYQQMYKPILAGSTKGEPAAGHATYVNLSGTYTDYRGTSWKVDYTVYLGKDNYQNFQVDRNSEYTNYITIKGIRNNDSYTDAGSVWMDHRVEASLAANQGADDCITITRETLIDSHIEVRPLRVKWNADDKDGEKMFARVYLPYYTEDNGNTWSQRDEISSSKKNWIGIELGDKKGSLYCPQADGPSEGKRKYFTNSLIQELNTESTNLDIVSESGQDSFILLANDGCAWIYIDEYIYAGNNVIATNDRQAKIVVELCAISDEAISVKNREEYVLFQKPLIHITSENNSYEYYTENYEEYLHSYDSHDKYNIETSPTDYTLQGLQWGPSNKMSKSQFVTEKIWDAWAPDNSVAYDFVHVKDQSKLSGYKIIDENGNDVNLGLNTGYNFTFNASANNGISISSMGRRPESAYQYCLSKNKFIESADGDDHKMKVSWYVPDVYELLNIFGSNNSPLATDSYYWSSQVPYTITRSNIYVTDIAAEVTDKARLVSDAGEFTDGESRDKKHRIRCLYNTNGIEADMSNRTPEGIGGMIKIPMTVANGGFFDYDDWRKDLEKEITPYPTAPSYRFPMGSSDPNSSKANSDFGGKTDDQGVHYYSKNPIDKKSWVSVVNDDWYSTIHESNWPGLTEYKVNNISIAGYSAVAELTNELKSIETTEIIREGEIIDGIPENVSSVPLDHNEGTENLYITFGAGANSSFGPLYEYYSEDASKANKKVWTKYWQVPTYTPDPANGKEESFKGSDRTLESTAETERLVKNEQLERNGYEIKSSKVVRTGDKWYNYKYHYEIVACKNKYYYTAAGGWGEAKKTYDGAEPPKSSKDALTIYAGNTFTISADEGYCIRSIKVNYNTSTIAEGRKYLRFVDTSNGLPDADTEPKQMTYLDGGNGWSKWVSDGEDTEVTLQLVICDKSAGNWWDQIRGQISMTHANPSNNTERGYSLIINSLELRVEQIGSTANQ